MEPKEPKEPKDPKARLPVVKLTFQQKIWISEIAARHCGQKWTEEQWQEVFSTFQEEFPLCPLNQTNFRQRVQRHRPSGVKARGAGLKGLALAAKEDDDVHGSGQGCEGGQGGQGGALFDLEKSDEEAGST